MSSNAECPTPYLGDQRHGEWLPTWLQALQCGSHTQIPIGGGGGEELEDDVFPNVITTHNTLSKDSPM